MTEHTWELLKLEATLICERLRTPPPPPDVEALIERAQYLQALGCQGRELWEVTRGQRTN